MDQNKLALFQLFNSCKILSNYLGKKNTKSLPNYIRANGNCICLICGKKYSKHPFDYNFLFTDCDGSKQPYLNILCDGSRVKL